MILLFVMCVISTCLPQSIAKDCNCEEECTRNFLERCKACKDGWFGPFCQKKNVALNGIASQKGIYTQSGIPMTADLAVDGNNNTNYNKRSCSHTDGRNNSWWSVQLGDNGVNQIRYMKIYNREEYNQNIWRRKGMEILIHGKRCKKWPDNEMPRTIEDVTCMETLTGHNLTIKVLGPYYSVCEVQVFVCSDDWYGEDCHKQCNCLYLNDVCDKVTGRCTRGCQAGYTGDDCQTLCGDGKYGINCSTWCGHCADNRTCDKTTGHCPGACMDGWVGRKCDAIDCNCEEECTRTLPQRCKACKAGWFGPFCEKRNVALNGVAIQKGTITSSGIPNTADLAVDGNNNTNPNKRSCAITDGRNNSWWSVQLGDNGVNQIRYMKIYNREKYYKWRRKGMEILVDGKRCRKWPDNEIPRTIEDVTCMETLTGHNLTITVLGPYYSVCEVQVFVCSDGWFGEDCDKQCNCVYLNDVCDKVTGRCTRGCDVGYMGVDCQTLCRDGKYGINCSTWCGHCADNRTCDKTTGHCPGACMDGWVGRKCDECRDGWYGEDCSSTCGHCMKGPCNKTSGDCHSACVEGWSGRKCGYDSDSMWHFVLKIVWAVGTGLFAFFLLFAGIIFCLLLLWRLHWLRRTAEKPGQASCDHVEMSDVTRPPASLYEAPTSSGNIGAEDDIYDVPL